MPDITQNADPHDLVGDAWPSESESSYLNLEADCTGASRIGSSAGEDAGRDAQSVAEDFLGQTGERVSEKLAGVATVLGTNATALTTAAEQMYDAAMKVGAAKSNINNLIEVANPQIDAALAAEEAGEEPPDGKSSDSLISEYRGKISAVAESLKTSLAEVTTTMTSLASGELPADSGAAPAAYQRAPAETPAERRAQVDPNWAQDFEQRRGVDPQAALPPELYQPGIPPAHQPGQPAPQHPGQPAPTPATPTTPSTPSSPSTSTPSTSSTNSSSTGTPSSPSAGSPATTDAAASAGTGPTGAPASGQPGTPSDSNPSSPQGPSSLDTALPGLALGPITSAAAAAGPGIAASAAGSATAGPAASTPSAAPSYPASSGSTPGTAASPGGFAPITPASSGSVSPATPSTPTPPTSPSPGTPAAPPTAAPTPGGQAVPPTGSPPPQPSREVTGAAAVQHFREAGEKRAAALVPPVIVAPVIKQSFIHDLPEAEAVAHCVLASLRESFEDAGWAQPIAVAVIEREDLDAVVFATADGLSTWPSGVKLPTEVYPLDAVLGITADSGWLGFAHPEMKLAAWQGNGVRFILTTEPTDVENSLPVQTQTVAQFREIISAGDAPASNVTRGADLSPDEANALVSQVMQAHLETPDRDEAAEALRSARWTTEQPSGYVGLLTGHLVAELNAAHRGGDLEGAAYLASQITELTDLPDTDDDEEGDMA